MSVLTSLKVFFLTWILLLLTFYAYYLYSTSGKVDVQQLFNEFGSNFKKISEQKLTPSTIKSLVNYRMNDKAYRMEYLKEYFASAQLEVPHLEKINDLLKGVNIDSLEEYEAKIRNYVNSEVEEDKKLKFLNQLDIFKENLPHLDEAIELMIQNLYSDQDKEL
ncbi:unnamed protein product [Bursaphelenchus okinawaensis]|uniref:Uncharacterized protein n=1 Tax=Bursaphelenchus okinawaensis TaxID=465554 RepID=A0A811KU34_9BILA|nr:unnamed protein product [Bursaphelenchus okinawaensis]CAG9112334.1 unnamed protein product [Bursaphelenchus okinawaensis]